MKVLLIGYNQFGYALYYHYCRYCPEDIQINYLEMSAGKPVILPPNRNIKVIHYQRNRGGRFEKLGRHLGFRARCIKEVHSKNYDLIVVRYFFLCALLRFFTRCPIILDIRTGAVSISKFKRWRQNLIMRLETMFFPTITILSSALARKLHLPKRKTCIVPLGTDLVNLGERDFDIPRLLYIGTFDGRSIEKTIQGMKNWTREHPDIEWTYDIIGSGDNGINEQKILAEASDPILKNRVRLHGYIHHSKIRQFYETSNIGVSYVPINEQYQCQPVTKTFEYIGAGIPVIATATLENRLVVNDDNGVLCGDNPESFSDALTKLWQHRDAYHEKTLKESIAGNTWEKITTELFQFWRNVVLSGKYCRPQSFR